MPSGWGQKHRSTAGLSKAVQVNKTWTGLVSLISEEPEVMEPSLCAGLGLGRGYRGESTWNLQSCWENGMKQPCPIGDRGEFRAGRCDMKTPTAGVVQRRE